MVFWGGKESTQGSLTLFLGFTPSLNLLHCLAIALTKKNHLFWFRSLVASSLVASLLGGEVTGYLYSIPIGHIYSNT